MAPRGPYASTLCVSRLELEDSVGTQPGFVLVTAGLRVQGKMVRKLSWPCLKHLPLSTQNL